MTFTIDNQEYTLHFRHLRTRDENGRIVLGDRGYTECLLHPGTCREKDFNRHREKILTGAIGWYGRSCCSPKDQFNKRVGRKLAFTRAIAIMTRDDRRSFWLAYLIATRITTGCRICDGEPLMRDDPKARASWHQAGHPRPA